MIRACFELLRLASLTGFSTKGAYWAWRMHTALGPRGRDAVGRRELRRAMIDYGRWISRMKRSR